MDRIRSILFGLVLALPAALPVSADVLLVDTLPASASTPASGISMSQVRQQFGNPVTEHPAVSVSAGPAQPPITRWDYAGFSVFFENDRVVHSVVHRESAN
jgi:hypothetical protein